MNMAYGVRSGAFTFDQVDAEARAALDSGQATPEQSLQLALMMTSMAKQMGMPERAGSYLEAAAMKASEGVTDEADAQEADLLCRSTTPCWWRRTPDKALELRRKMHARRLEGRRQRAEQLRLVVLRERHQAGSGPGIGPEGRRTGRRRPGQRANMLDTAAEICNALGNCDEAIAHIQRAIELDPEKQYFKDQLVKFEKAAKEKKDS